MFYTDSVDSSNLVIINFHPYTGGNFIKNCLSLSRHTLFIEADCVDYLISNPSDYNYRLAKVLRSLPTQNNMSQWTNYEMDRLMSVELLDHKDINSARRTNIKKIIHSGMIYFAIAHGDVNEIKSLIDVWKNSKIIKLVNSQKFQTICLELKKSNRTLSINGDITRFNGNECEEKYNILKGSDWPIWKEFELSGCDTRQFKLEENIKQEMGQYYKWNTVPNQRFMVDIDSNMFDTDRMIEEIRKLYDKLSFDDFSPDLVRQYHVPYLKLHTISQA